MKIAVYHNLPSGGARRALYEMVERLAARGYVLDEFCPQTADRSFLPLDAYVRRTVVLPFQPRGIWSNWVPLLTPYVNSFRLTQDLVTIAKVGKQAAQTIDGGGYDVVFTHDCQLAQNPDVLRFLETPSVYYCHHGARSRLPEPDRNRPTRGLVDRAKVAYYALPKQFYPWLRERRAARNIEQAAQVLTNSYFAREGLVRAYGVEAQVCYLGVDTDRFRPLYLDREPFILSVGAVHYHKGYRFLIRTLGRLPTNRRPSLVVVANGTDSRERKVIEAMARELDVDLTIQCITDDKKLVSLYNRASAFVYTPVMEPLGLVVLEAMACGAPVVAVREGGIRESVVDGEIGLLVDRDENAFAAALTSVLTNRPYAEQLGRTAANNARANWTWEHTVDRLEQIFTRVVSEQRYGA